MRDRAAALMVRAAVTNAIDYTRADPYSRQWRIKHLLTIREMGLQLTGDMLEISHRHYSGYVANSGLTADSWGAVKNKAEELTRELYSNICPWEYSADNQQKTDTIENQYGDLIRQYRELMAEQQGNTENNNE